MRLWNDYEGLILEGAFPIEKLLRPEGRSAVFSTHNGSGVPTVLRLIESVHDDDEILDRWKTVSALNQPNLVAFKKFGKTVLDGEPLVYAVFEPTEMCLADILCDRALTVDETQELAASLIVALQSLHAAGLVHEHITTSNILATQDAIKLRSDCIRGIPDHLPQAEAYAPIARDVRDLSLVLFRALTQMERLADADRDVLLPEPFHQIIHNGTTGSWDLPQIAAHLNSSTRTVADPPAPTPTSAASVAAAPTPAPVPAPQAVSITTVPEPYKPAPYVAPAATPSKRRPANAPSANYSPVAVAAAIPYADERAAPFDFDGEPQSAIVAPLKHFRKHKPLWLASGAVSVLLLSLVWHSFHATSHAAQPNQASSAASLQTDKPVASKPSAAITAPRSVTPRTTPERGTASTGQQWRVVAYTYNSQDQAQHKADEIARDHHGLRPEVFTPSGHAPYLVTLGGSMTRDKAIALRDKALQDGLPHDIYTQNYTARTN
jgi:hypothetical protein